MSKFYVGQTVRVVSQRKFNELSAPERIVAGIKPAYIGMTGTILRASSWAGEWLVDCDDGIAGSFAPYQIEPIPDDSRTLVSWNSIKSEDGRVIWQPGRVCG